jgi:hypothetical protein
MDDAARAALVPHLNGGGETVPLGKAVSRPPLPPRTMRTRGAISEPGIEPFVYMCTSWNEAVDTKRSRSVFGGVPGR